MARIIKDVNDKFYTNPKIVDKLLNTIKGDYDLYIEPSAGNGSFSKVMREKFDNVEAYDILPESDNILEMNWFDYKTEKNNICVIGNPPFGKQSKLALEFIKHCDKLKIDKIAFVLPLSFKKISNINKLPVNYHVIYDEILPKNSFLLNGSVYDVPCVWVILERREEKRIKIKSKTVTDFFQIVKKPEEGDISIRRVGVNAGKVFNDTDRSTESHYFIKNSNKVSIEKLTETLNNAEYIDMYYTSGPLSLNKTELIETFEKNIK